MRDLSTPAAVARALFRRDGVTVRIKVNDSKDLTAALMRGLEAHLLTSGDGERARRRLGLGAWA